MDENQTIAQSEGQQTITPAETMIPQSRLDEVVAKQREAERQAAELQQKMLEQSMRMAEQAAQFQAQFIQAQQRNAPAPVDNLAPLRERDPDLARIIEADRAATAAQYGQKLAALEAQMKATEVRLAVSAIPGAPPEVAQAAQTYMQRWAAAGVPASADDAINFAWGEFARKQNGRVAGVRDQQNQFQPVLTSPNPSIPVQQSQAPALPANFNQLSPDQQNQVLDNIYGNMPF